MRIGFISDIHGNVIAFRRCLQLMDALKPNKVFFLGDAVGYMPGERQVLAMLEDRHILCQRGNHEAMMRQPDARAERSEAVYQLRPAAARLGEAALDRIAAWPDARRVEADGVRILLVHGSPQRPLDGYLYEDADWSGYDELPEDAVFFGHTHRPFVVRHSRKLFVNIGSVGLPRDQGNLGSFAVFDGGDRTCRLYRFTFDVNEVLRSCGAGLDAAVRECLRRQSPQVAGERLDG